MWYRLKEFLCEWKSADIALLERKIMTQKVEGSYICVIDSAPDGGRASQWEGLMAAAGRHGAGTISITNYGQRTRWHL